MASVRFLPAMLGPVQHEDVIPYSVAYFLPDGKTRLTNSCAHRGQTGNIKWDTLFCVRHIGLVFISQKKLALSYFFKNSLDFNSALGRDIGPSIYFSLYNKISDDTSAKIKGKQHLALESEMQQGVVETLANWRAHAPSKWSTFYLVTAPCCLVFPLSTVARYSNFSYQKMEI